MGEVRVPADAAGRRAPGVFAVVATGWAKLPADELAHPLRDVEADDAEAALVV